MEYLIYLAIFVFGSIIGSFLNAVIYRLPREKSLIKPSYSFCPNCESKIRWYDNIPIFSYLFLGGKCRSCGEKISVRYILVEILTGLLSVVSFLKTGISIDYLFVFGFFALLVAITFIDIDFKIIPDELNLVGFILGVVYLFFRNDLSWIDGILGVLVGSGFLWSVAFLYLRFRGIEGLGMGDVKMMAFVGVYLGWFGALFTIFLGSFLGAVVGILGAYVVKAEDKSRFEIPFGPFLAFAAGIYMVFGEQIKSWYLGG